MFLPPLSFKISLRDTSFYISLNSLRFYLSRMLVEFSLIYIFQHVRAKCFNLWCSHSQKISESMLFYSCSSPPLKTSGRIFWKFVFPKTERVVRTYDLLYQNSIRKYVDNLEHWLISICYDCNFSKCDGFSYNYVINIYQLVSDWLYYLFLATMVIWNYNYSRKYSYLNEGWLFIGRFKVRNLPRMINKEVLAQFIHKPT